MNISIISNYGVSHAHVNGSEAKGKYWSIALGIAIIKHLKKRVSEWIISKR